jgi:hypothetical protein
VKFKQLLKGPIIGNRLFEKENEHENGYLKARTKFAIYSHIQKKLKIICKVLFSLCIPRKVYLCRE